MNVKVIIPLVVILFLCVGLFFLGKGITGTVVSQSCCFGPDCAPEYMCDAESYSNSAGFLGFGAILILVSILVFVMLHSKFNSI